MAPAWKKETLVYKSVLSNFHRKILDDLSSADAALHKNSSADPLSAAAAATLQAHHIQVCINLRIEYGVHCSSFDLHLKLLCSGRHPASISFEPFFDTWIISGCS